MYRYVSSGKREFDGQYRVEFRMWTGRQNLILSCSFDDTDSLTVKCMNQIPNHHRELHYVSKEKEGFRIVTLHTFVHYIDRSFCPYMVLW